MPDSKLVIPFVIKAYLDKGQERQEIDLFVQALKERLDLDDKDREITASEIKRDTVEVEGTKEETPVIKFDLTYPLNPSEKKRDALLDAVKLSLELGAEKRNDRKKGQSYVRRYIDENAASYSGMEH